MNKRLVVLVALLLLPVLVLSAFRAPGLSLDSASAAGTVLDAVEETVGGIVTDDDRGAFLRPSLVGERERDEDDVAESIGGRRRHRWGCPRSA